MATWTTRLLALLAIAILLAPQAAAHAGGAPGNAFPWVEPAGAEFVKPRDVEAPCPRVAPQWREAQNIEGVTIQASTQCMPDDPRWIAAFTKGTNHVSKRLLEDTGIHPDSVVKGADLDGDGDADEITITLEIMELNGWSIGEDTIASPGYFIAPGVETGFWVFAPKTTRFHGGPVDGLWRMPSPVLRVEEGDKVTLVLENTHYMPHTIHLHGVDHPFTVDGEGNDGVPHLSEDPTLPGQKKVYQFTARQPGTMYYHCHVHPHVHVLMGLNGALIVEPNRPNNALQTINVGAGEVRNPSVYTRENYDREFDLHYQDVDKELNDRIDDHNDPRFLEWSLHRDYDATDRKSDYFLLNGKSFPYTMRESLVTVGENEDIRLHVLNGGSDPISLHLHGHKPIATHADGVKLAEPLQRDVFTLTAAQRLELHVKTQNNGLDSYGPGAWFMHDHQENAVTTDGIGPGGDITVLVYEGFQDNRSFMPKTLGMPWVAVYSPDYYDGLLPVFQGQGVSGWSQPPDEVAQLPTKRIADPAAFVPDGSGISFWLAVPLLVFGSFWRRP